MFKLVLLALSDLAGGKDAARLACDIAARHDSGFAVLHVSGPLKQSGGCVLQLPGDETLATRRTEVEQFLRDIMPPGLTADVLVSAGFAHVEILKAARVLEPDLIVLGGLDETETCRRELSAALSGEALLVARSSACPVLVASPAVTSTGTFKRMLVCTDISEGEQCRVRNLLALAARLAANEGAELRVLCPLPLLADQPSPSHEEMARRLASSRNRLTYLCQGLPGSERFSIMTSEGDPCVEILKIARERQADLLILGPQSEGQDEAMSRVLANSRCPVLVVGYGSLARQSANPAPTHEGYTACHSTS